MNIENVVQVDTVRQISAMDGHPSIIEVVFNDTGYADRILGGLFVNDSVRLLNAEWAVWNIDDRRVTLLRIED